MRVGVWGLDHPHAGGYAESLLGLEEVARVVTWQRLRIDDAVRGRASGRVEEASRSLGASLRRRDVDLLVVCASASATPKPCALALSAGVPVLAEKPVARDARRLRRLVAISEEHDVQLGVAYVNRHQSHIVDARRIIRGGELGAVKLVELRLLASQIRRRGAEHWLFREADSGGGVLVWLGCHLLDVIEYVTGDRAGSIAAETATADEAGVDIEAVALVSLRLGSGAVATIQTGYVLPFASPGYAARDAYDASGNILCRDGAVSWRSTGTPTRLTVATHDGGPSQIRYAADRTPGYAGRAGRSFVPVFVRWQMIRPCRQPDVMRCASRT